VCDHCEEHDPDRREDDPSGGEGELTLDSGGDIGIGIGNGMSIDSDGDVGFNIGGIHIDSGGDISLINL